MGDRGNILSALLAIFLVLAVPAFAQGPEEPVTPPTCAEEVSGGGRWASKAAVRTKVVAHLRTILSAAPPYPAVARLASALEIDPTTLRRWAEADLPPEDFARWIAGAQKKKPAATKRWAATAGKRPQLAAKVRAFLAGPAPYPTRGKVATDLGLDPGTVDRWSEEDLRAEELAAWDAGAERFKPATKKTRKPQIRIAVLADVRANLAIPIEQRPLLSIGALCEKHGVDDNTIVRWLRRDLTGDEPERWRESSRRRPPRLDYKKDEALGAERRAAVVAFVRERLASPVVEYATVQQLSERFSVAIATVMPWLEADLSADELARWSERRVQLVVDASAEKREERWREGIRDFVESVLEEIAEARVTPTTKLRTNPEFALLYGVTPRAISRRLSASLSVEDQAFRERHLQVQGQLNSVAELSAEKEARAALVVAHLLAEAEEIRLGQRQTFSTNEELAELFESSATVIDRVLQTMPAAFRVARARLQRVRIAKARNAPFNDKRRAIAEQARREMDEYRAGQRKSFTSNTDLAAAQGIASEWVASAAIGSALTADEITLRARVLRADGRPEYRELEEELLAHVRAQLAVAANDPEALLSTTEELSVEFGIETTTVMRWIRRGFSAEDQATRQARIATERARRSHATRRSGVSAVVFEGRTFDSMSEAAVSSLLAKYAAAYDAEEGVSLHVQIGRLEYDFRVGKFLVEYHPIIAMYPGGDFRSAEEYASFLVDQEGLEPAERIEYRRRTFDWLGERYRAGRAANDALTSTGLELVFAPDVNDLFAFLERADVPKRVPLPTLAGFRSEFRTLLNTLRAARQAQRAAANAVAD